MPASALVLRSIETIMVAGSAVTWLADNPRKPTGPSSLSAVTTVMPVARMPRVRQKVFMSMPVVSLISVSGNGSGCGPYQTTGWVAPVCTLTKPWGIASLGATSAQAQGAQVSVANWRRSGKPGHQRGEKVGSYSHSIALASA